MTSAAQPWWQGAVIYQIYIRSFCDGNGDGQGDFEGLVSKLDYVASLGVDAIWLSPIHPSPNRDWGYDVSDYDGVHPDYGTDGDFTRLIKEAHARGLKVLTDEVLAHTSDEHPWFLDSLKNGEKADWYVWAPPKLDGTVPNNWLSAFAGPAWSYQPARRLYYHHKFLRQQPKLNWRNAATRAALLAVLDRWLARGVDGFRLDVANAFLHDPTLADNPAVPMAMRDAHNWAHAPNLQFHHHDSNLAGELEVLDEIRRVVERYADRFVMGEFSEEPERCGCFAPPDVGLHSGYSFPLLEARKLTPGLIRGHYEMLDRHRGHWPSIAFSNHDVARTVSRFGGKHPAPEFAKLMLALLFAMKGTALLYQGEELGLPQAEIRRNQIRDPVGDLYYPYTFGRDGCRTPMPWDADIENFGFSTGVPWLPPSPSHRPLAVSEQQSSHASTLSFAREMVRLRKSHAPLRLGDICFLDSGDAVLAFSREHEGQSILCVFNLDGQTQVFADARLAAATPIGPRQQGVEKSGAGLSLAPFAVWFGLV